jgi:hypothetical protein
MAQGTTSTRFLFDKAEGPFSASTGVVFLKNQEKQILEQPQITQLFLWNIRCAGPLLEPTAS